MPVSKKKPTTLTAEVSMQESPSAGLRLAGKTFVSIYVALP
jgi:hypothetical protein